MNLFIAIWSLRLALLATLLVGGVSLATGAELVEAIDRALIAAFTLTLFGRLLVGWLEPTADRLARQRVRAARAPARPAPGTPSSVRDAARRQMARPAAPTR